jgi:hypothetical protein
MMISVFARVVGSAAVIGALAWAPEPAAAQFIQQGPKLVGIGVAGSTVLQGASVAVSADGNTAIVGGNGDNSADGAAWVFVRRGGVWTQQGSKLVGAGAVGKAQRGISVALSADGNTAVVGGTSDNSIVGAAWVFTRSNGVWTQQGDKLVGAGVVGRVSYQGISVGLSADGNTAIIGGYGDNSDIGGALGVGAAWVFTRSNGVWAQQAKLVGTGAIGLSNQGLSVSISADGNTAIVGGYGDNSEFGAAWVFTRSNGLWSQQGSKLVGAGAIGPSFQGRAVALSADGNTAMIGGFSDNWNTGAVWVFTRSNGVWAQQGNKLVGTGAVQQAQQGLSVALSADGDTAIIGGNDDNGLTGATWVFTRSSGVWTQQGSKLVGTGSVGQPGQGWSVALSADGRSTAISGGPGDNFFGAAWVFTAPRKLKPNTHDFNGDGKSDIAWRDLRGNTAIWLMNGTGILSPGEIGAAPTSWSIVGQRDFDGDGKADLLWRDTSGNTAIWFMNGLQIASARSVGDLPTTWSVVGTGDFNGDGMGDILLRDASGNLAVWLMNGATVSSAGGIGSVPSIWSIAGTGDFDGDGKTDLLWRDTSGNTAIWFMNGVQVASSAVVIASSGSIVGIGDFNGDGKSDIVWRDTLGNTAIWLMNGATLSSAGGLGNVPTTWSMVLTGDYDGDGKSDLLWRDVSGDTAIWFMNGVSVASAGGIGNVPAGWVPWTVQSANAE